MTVDSILSILMQAMWVAFVVCAPLMGVALVIGVLINIVQVITQIQDSSLSFIPKLIGVAICVVVLGAWMLRKLVQYTEHLWGDIPRLVS